MRKQLVQLSALPLLVLAACLFSLPTAVLGHEHHDEGVDWDEERLKPIDSILWLHIYLQLLIWAIVFPAGMVLGLTRSRWHVPMQVTATVVTLGGIWLGHAHGGRSFPHSKHGSFASWLFWIILLQAGIGTFLKLHVMQDSTFRKAVLVAHSILGRLYPVFGYVQMLLGIITGLDLCGGGHLGQCLAHHIMGSSFMGYGIFILIMSLHGAPWLKNRGMSQEFLDSTVIMIWGIINTFTEHNFLESSSGWSHKDMQHTSLGVLFWTGGALGMWLSRKQKRSIWPALVIALTGFAMSGHEQATMLSTMVHTIFGYTLMLAGVCRIIEICFVLRETHDPPNDGEITAFQHTTPFLLMAGGLQFMSATEEELSIVGGIGMDHVTYIIILFCITFLIYLWTNMLIALYHNSGRSASQSDATNRAASDRQQSWWQLLVSGATSHYDAASGKAAEVEYEQLDALNSRLDSIELGERGGSGGNATQRVQGLAAGGTTNNSKDDVLRAANSRRGGSQRVFDAAEYEDGFLEDDGADSYWSGSGETLGEGADAKEIRTH